MLSGALLLDDLGHTGAARHIRDAVAATLRDARHHTADLGGNATTADVSSAVLHAMESQEWDI
ncbi:isocitrate/isopropylmalate family dehydrogenase [Streptomyces sp. ME19-01-6]|nr:isocitrate/isopropylmalate family dehydrogenase [Streptomyces sp. ME19-01-6]